MSHKLKHINLKTLDEIFDGDKEILSDSIDVFIEISGSYYSSLKEAYAAGDWDLLGKVAHKAKASVRTMGMNELGEHFNTLELNAKGLVYKKLQSKEKLSQEENKLLLYLKESDLTKGDKSIADKEFSIIEQTFHEAVNEIKNVKQNL